MKNPYLATLAALGAFMSVQVMAANDVTDDEAKRLVEWILSVK